MEKQRGEAPFAARARLMLLLGEQLITDEVAALAELIKNSYDADASNVQIHLKNVSKKNEGIIVILDNGHGMTRQKILDSWLELGTISKAKGGSDPERVSEGLRRPYLGEKGLGRLAVHKIGKHIELVSRRKDTFSETKLNMDWSMFEDVKKYLGDVKVEWEEKDPEVFTESAGFSHGTRITVTNMHRVWTADILKKIKQFVWSMQSPFSNIVDFKVELIIDDVIDPNIKFQTIDELFSSAHYSFSAKVDSFGIAHIDYSFRHPTYKDLHRTIENQHRDLKQPEEFPEGRKPLCGGFKFHIYCWDLDPSDKRATFGEGDVYESMVKPQTGVKLFRDRFRVLPYGNEDNDWLNMDQRRIERFQENVSRNQVIGYVEISSNANPDLLDKSDREGLIDNDAFRDFKSLLISAIRQFQTERNVDRHKVKSIKKETKGDPKSSNFTQQMRAIAKILTKANIPYETRNEILKEIDRATKIFEETVAEIEEPLLGAASIGLTYMIPTHELRRNIQESLKVAKLVSQNSGPEFANDIKVLIELLCHSEDIIRGLVKISQRIRDEEQFSLKKPIETAISLMQQKLSRNNISIKTDYQIQGNIKGSERLISIMLVNMIDNSVYWLGTKRQDERQIKFTICEYDLQTCLIVSDNGPGIQDDLELLTLPFFTRKTKGMGLGLFICNRIVELHNGTMRLFSEGEYPGLLSGANIAVLFPREK